MGRRLLAIRFQSTLPMKGATKQTAQTNEAQKVSIHAPNEGSDSHLLFPTHTRLLFQSTLPMKGATLSKRIINCKKVSIHAPNEGSDGNIWVKKYPYRQILVLLLLFYLQTF